MATTLCKFLLFLCLCFGALENGDTKELTQNLIPCREGWYLFGGKCYKVEGESEGLVWEKASAKCSQEGGSLVTLYSKEQRDFIFTFLLLNAASDLCINDREQEGKYVWDDGSVVNYTDWDMGEPSGYHPSSQDCVLFRFWTPTSDLGRWNDDICDYEIPYICQLTKNERYQNPDPRFCSSEKGGGWKYLNSCYHVVTEKKSWGDAERYCQENFNGHLATVLDFRTEYFLNYILSSYTQSFWYGIKLREEKEQQQWSSGWEVIFNRWGRYVPFTEGTCAMRSSKNTWDRVSCSQKSSFVCEVSTDKPPVEEKGPCPESSEKWKRANGKLCYLVETREWRTWHDANNECKRKGGALVSIHSKEEHNDLYNFLKPLRVYHAYMGLHRKIEKDGEFEWSDGGKFSYHHWLPGSPRDNHEVCGTLFAIVMGWHDEVSCEDKQPYICSATKVPPPEPEVKPYVQTSSGCTVFSIEKVAALFISLSILYVTKWRLVIF